MKKLFVSLSMIALMGAGCMTSAPEKPATPPTTNAPAPEAPSGKMTMAGFMTGSWKIKSMQQPGGVVQDVSKLDLTLNFDGSKMTGKVCNSMNGSYTVSDNLVKFGPVMSTKMFCDGLPGQVESALETGFSNNITISKQDDNLVMTGGAVLVLERQGDTTPNDGRVY